MFHMLFKRTSCDCQYIVLHADMVPFVGSNNQQHVTVSEGQAVVIDLPPLECYPAPTVIWRNMLNGRVIMNGIQHHHLSLDNQLVILSTQMSRDNGSKFRSEAENIYTQEKSHSPTFFISINGEHVFLSLCLSLC